MFFLDLVGTNSSNPIIYFLFIILFIVIIAILLLLYLQNKEMRDSLSVKINDDENTSMLELIAENDNYSKEEVKDLQEISKELEQLPKEHPIDMSKYELEQEQQAIISYDELVKQTQNSHIYKEENNDINTTQVTSNLSGYEHEEEYLKQLKQLKNILN